LTPAPTALPQWARELIALYESQCANQFILYGNVNDRFVLPLGQTPQLGSLYDFLLKVMMPRFDVVISYDLGNGIRVERGAEVFSKWPALSEAPEYPRAPRPAIEFATRYFRYVSNLARLGQGSPRVGFYIKAAHLVAPALPGALNYDLNAIALLMRDWCADDALREHSLVTWLIADNINDMHPLIVNNPRAASVELPLPSADELRDGVEILAPQFPVALRDVDRSALAQQLVGATITSIERLLRLKERDATPLANEDLVVLKKDLIERDSAGLIEFIESKKTLDDLHGQEKLKQWLRQDIALWRKNDLNAMPMGYLICGPVGTGKTFLVECLAGEAGVPVVKLKNFRDKWVGSTEGNLEKVFRLLKALGRCFVFIDEADQALGKRDSGANDAGLSGRIYSMFATEMSNTANRGKIVWILATSRPDLIEIDLKRPGRVDVKIPIFPTTTPQAAFELLRALSSRRGIAIDESGYKDLESLMPELLTPGAAETLAVKLYRTIRTEELAPLEALRKALTGYANPVPLDVMEAQITLAAREASDVDFVPEVFRRFR
jgi:SpoVK/Ycf46/Vps4 family AAA+-type ATPase